jgi:hypothetical protein
MLIPESRIRAALLDPRRGIHLQASEYWQGNMPADPTAMPLMIQAVNNVGHKSAYHLLCNCEGLPQSEATIDWMMAEIDRPLDLSNVAEFNYCFSLALIIVHADPALLAPRYKAILALRNFPKQLAVRLDRRLRYWFLQWPALWFELEEYGRRLLARDSYSVSEGELADDLVEAMGRLQDGADQVMRAIRLDVPRHQLPLHECLLSELIRIAAGMRLHSVVPRVLSLIGELDKDDICMFEACEAALISTCTDRVIETIATRWPESPWTTRLSFAAVLEKVRGEQSLRTAIRLLAEEEEPSLIYHLGAGVLCQFRTEGLAAINDLLIRVNSKPRKSGSRTIDDTDLRQHLLAMCVIAGIDFPELETHMAEAIEKDFKFYTGEPGRIAVGF